MIGEMARGAPLAPPSAPRVRRIRDRIWRLPMVAGIGLTAVLVLTIVFGVVNQRHLRRIERALYPTLQLDRSLGDQLEHTQEALRAAVAVRDSDRLAEADSARAAFGAALRGGRRIEGLAPATLDTLDRGFATYYVAARGASAAVVARTDDAAARARVVRMVATFSALRDTLAARAERDQRAIEHAFAVARRFQNATWIGVTLVAVGCVALLGWMAVVTTRGIVGPLQAAVEVADRVAGGDLAVTFPRAPDDEIGQLLGSLRVMVASMSRSIRELRTSEARLAASEGRFRALVQQSSDIVIVLDARSRVRYASPSMERVCGFPTDVLVGGPVGSLLHADDEAQVRTALASVAGAPGATVSLRHRFRHADGSWRHVESVVTNLLHDPAVGGYVCNTRDVTERTTLEEQLTHQAFHDPLTGLANRALFRDRVEQALAPELRGDAGAGGVAVLFLDLDNFKTVNDSLGHAAGDRLLTTVAGRLLNATRGCDTVARLGGDEFAILLQNLHAESEPVAVAERVTAAMRAPVTLDGKEVFVGASVGIAYGLGDTTAAELLRNADAAMYDAKGSGKGRYAVYDPALHAAAVDRIELETDLARAVERGEFELLFQPIVDLDEGGVVAAEALLRWRHPSRGVVAPMRFVPLAEETGLIVPLGRWVLREACRRAAEWGDAAPVSVTVNVSGRQLEEPELVDDVRAALAESGLLAERLTLEITESVVMRDTALILQRLHALKALGVRLAIDDFGTGYSSLSYLRRFPIDVLKIDKSFVDGVTRGGHDAVIARTIIALGEMLSMTTVAEGIEHAEQRRELREFGCEMGQGYLFARPLPASAIRELVRASAATRPAAAAR